MLHHISFAVSDLERSAAFYDVVLATLGYQRVWTNASAVGYGLAGGGDKFAIKQRGDTVRAPPAGFHLAFSAPARSAVDQFHEAALRVGGENLGGPGLRANYGADYYATFVRDPDGYVIEAVINHAVGADGSQGTR